MSYNAVLIIVLAIYIVLNLCVGLLAAHRQGKNDFVRDYFIGGRSMGGLVLAMTLVATFTSASSFIGGPGVAFSKGLSWVYLSMIQVPTAFIILGIMGKKLAVISRETGAVTITDFLRMRYRSPAVVWISSICMLLFFLAQMMSQFIGGAVLFQSITGLPYLYGLILFGLVVIVYTAIGGFRAVVTTDTIQGIVMVIGSFILLYTVVHQAGGFTPMIRKLNEVNPNWADITSGGSTPKAMIMSFWALVGIGVLGLPQTAVRNMGFRDTKALHDAMIYGTVVVGLIMLVMHISGVFAPAILDPSSVKNTDYVIPALVTKYMDPAVAGLFIAAPLAAVMSTVSSLLILASATIVKDLYLNYIVKSQDKRKELLKSRKIAIVSWVTTLVIGSIVFVLTIYPPDIIVWINLFAMGGLECAFFCPIVFGLFWKKANKNGCILSSLCGVISFLVISNTGFSLFGTMAIVPSMIISVITFVIGSFLGGKNETLCRDAVTANR